MAMAGGFGKLLQTQKEKQGPLRKRLVCVFQRAGEFLLVASVETEALLQKILSYWGEPYPSGYGYVHDLLQAPPQSES